MKILALIVFLHILFLPMALVFYQLFYTYVYGVIKTRNLNIGTALISGSCGLKDSFLYELTALDQQMVCNLGRVLSPPNSSS
jgi:CobQ-like glutamine amidotransferase family enzyme